MVIKVINNIIPTCIKELSCFYLISWQNPYPPAYKSSCPFENFINLFGSQNSLVLCQVEIWKEQRFHLLIQSKNRIKNLCNVFR